MEKIRISDANTSKREKDSNGFLIIKDNPIAKAGVFDYLLSEVFSHVEKDKDKIVHVCREFSNLQANKDLFKGKPIKWAHYWVGKEGETQTADGAIFGDVRADEPYLKADLIIYNKDLITKIEAGEVVELSPAYEADIEAGEGSYDGEGYAFKQKLKEVNHLAVVETGRSGSDLRIYDEKKTEGKMKTKDKGLIRSLISKLKDEEAQLQEDSSTEAIAKILEISNSEGSDDEKLLSIIEFIKGLSNEAKDEEAEKESETKDEEVEKETQDEEAEVEAKEITLKPDELVELIEKVTDSKIKKLQDSLNVENKNIAKAYKEVSQALGTSFDFIDKSASEIYKFGYEALTKQKLQDSLDSKSAFIAVSNMKAQKVAQKVVDSVSTKEHSKIDSLLSRYK